MRTAKKLGTILSLLVLCVTLMAVSAFAAKTIDNGSCGDNLTWTLDDAGTLTISGTGDMENYSYWECAPWRNSSSISKKLIFPME